MRIVVVTSQSFIDERLLVQKLDKVTVGLRSVEIITWDGRWRHWPGGLPGKWALDNWYPLAVFHPNPKKGKDAISDRNEEMIEHGQALVAFWDGLIGGVSHVIELAEDHSLPTKVVRY